jgi:hypothetical protein
MKLQKQMIILNIDLRNLLQIIASINKSMSAVLKPRSFAVVSMTPSARLTLALPRHGIVSTPPERVPSTKQPQLNAM